MNQRGHLPHRVGDLTCPGVDVDEYRARCRVPLYPNQWNVWEVWVSNTHAKTESQVFELTRDFLRHTFAAHADVAIQGLTLGPAEYVNAAVGPYATLKSTGVPPGIRKTAVSRETVTCDVLPTVEGDKPILVTVAFVFRGNETSWSWPTLGDKWRLTIDRNDLVTGWCPIGAQAILQRAFRPVTDEHVPAPGGIWQNVRDENPDFAENAEIVGGAVRSFVAGGTSRLAFFLGGAALASFLLLRKSK